MTMAEAGADLIEIGIPFSDPVAEGPVIQEADIRALAAGTTTDKIFAMVARVREKSAVPLALMTYSAQGSDVVMTMVDGRILYENGEFLTLDADRILHDARACVARLYR